MPSKESNVQWGMIVECLPWEDKETEEDLRSEMWSLFNISDTKTLTLYDLEKGVTTVTQSEELFDCLPAVRAAFHYTKVFFNNGIDEEEEAEKKAKEEEAQKEKNGKKEDLEEVIKAPLPKVEKTLEFPEFRMFLQSLRQYYLYCQLFRNDDVNPKKSIKKKKFLKEENIHELSKWIKEDLCWEEEFDKLDDNMNGKIVFEDFIRWAFKKNMKLELEKLEERRRAEEVEENGENGNREEE